MVLMWVIAVILWLFIVGAAFVIALALFASLMEIPLASIVNIQRKMSELLSYLDLSVCAVVA